MSKSKKIINELSEIFRRVPASVVRSWSNEWFYIGDLQIFIKSPFILKATPLEPCDTRHYALFKDSFILGGVFKIKSSTWRINRIAVPAGSRIANNNHQDTKSEFNAVRILVNWGYDVFSDEPIEDKETNTCSTERPLCKTEREILNNIIFASKMLINSKEEINRSMTEIVLGWIIKRYIKEYELLKQQEE